MRSVSKSFAAGVFVLLLALVGRAQVTFTDNFSTPVNYLTNGIVGTIWDGIYLGAGEIANSTGIGAAAGSVSMADASISSNNTLTIASLETDWENTADDGVFLFKVITGNFDMSVHVLGPFVTTPSPATAYDGHDDWRYDAHQPFVRSSEMLMHTGENR